VSCRSILSSVGFVYFIFLSLKEPLSNSGNSCASLGSMPSYNAYISDSWNLSTLVGSVKAKQVNKNRCPVLATRVVLGARSNLEAFAVSSQTCLQNSLPRPGHCREPPPWKHEDSKRIYHFVEGQSVHYECIPGYKALQRGPAISICKMKCGKTGWTQPQLTCVDEREHHRFLGKLFLSCVLPILSSSGPHCHGIWESHVAFWVSPFKTQKEHSKC
jgi:hypothetical protein